jgi:hypothetical protein
MVHLASCIFNAIWEAAIAACPRLMPPSLGGTAEFVKTFSEEADKISQTSFSRRPF